MKRFVTVCAVLLICASATLADQDTNNPVPQSGSLAASSDFTQPNTLTELLALSPDQLEKVDVARIDLLCAEGLRGSENLDVEFLIRTLNGWAYHIESETKRNFHRFTEHPEEFKNSLAYFRMGMMGTILVEDMRIQYNPERERQQDAQPIDSRTPAQWSTFFTDSRDVFIHGLVTGKHVGTCASMPFLYAAIGRRLGYPVTIAARKFHLYARYEEEDGKHLNVEATENQGFSTPSDEEYRNGEFPMTDEEIKGCGWLRPLSNKEILGICLLTRSSCLRSMKRYDDEIATRAQAARYLPNTPLMKRVNEKNNDLSRNLQAEDRWNELWDEVEQFLLPTAGPRFEHFQDRKLQTQLFMNQSTNLAEIEKSVRGLKDELASYRAEVSDDPTKLNMAFGKPQPSPVQRQFLSLLADVPQDGRIPLPEEKVPPEYRQSVPWELEVRLSGMKDAQDIVNEMWAYRQQQEVKKQDEQRHEIMSAKEEALHVMRARGITPPASPQPTPRGTNHERPDDGPPNKIPEIYRAWITPEIASRLTDADIWQLQQNEKNREVSKRGRKSVEQMHEDGRIRQMPLYRIVPAPGPTLPLTPEPQSPITPIETGKGQL